MSNVDSAGSETVAGGPLQGIPQWRFRYPPVVFARETNRGSNGSTDPIDSLAFSSLAELAIQRWMGLYPSGGLGLLYRLF